MADNATDTSSSTTDAADAPFDSEAFWGGYDSDSIINDTTLGEIETRTGTPLPRDEHGRFVAPPEDQTEVSDSPTQAAASADETPAATTETSTPESSAVSPAQVAPQFTLDQVMQLVQMVRTQAPAAPAPAPVVAEPSDPILEYLRNPIALPADPEEREMLRNDERVFLFQALERALTKNPAVEQLKASVEQRHAEQVRVAEEARISTGRGIVNAEMVRIRSDFPHADDQDLQTFLRAYTADTYKGTIYDVAKNTQTDFKSVH